MKQYSVRSKGNGAADNTIVDSISKLLDAIVHGLEWAEEVIVTEIQKNGESNNV